MEEELPLLGRVLGGGMLKVEGSSTAGAGQGRLCRHWDSRGPGQLLLLWLRGGKGAAAAPTSPLPASPQVLRCSLSSPSLLSLAVCARVQLKVFLALQWEKSHRERKGKEKKKENPQH